MDKLDRSKEDTISELENRLAKLRAKYPMHVLFEILPVTDGCQWPGTTWRDNPKHPGRKILNPCGADTVGAGMFCDPSHLECRYMSVCEEHKGTADFYKTQGWEL